MFTINEDMSIYITRGDAASFTVTAEENGENHIFQPGDVARFKVVEKKNCEAVVLQKDFAVEEATDRVDIHLTERDTKIGEVISKPTDYWYEVELDPFTDPRTILGYDDDGAKIFKLFPEGDDVEEAEPTPEDIPVVDDTLDMTSTRPVQNQAVAREIADIRAVLKTVEDDVANAERAARETADAAQKTAAASEKAVEAADEAKRLSESMEQSDWTEEDETLRSFIRNKPPLSKDSNNGVVQTGPGAGRENQAYNSSAALGAWNRVRKGYSLAHGWGNQVDAEKSAAFGAYNLLRGNANLANGRSNETRGYGGASLGQDSVSVADNAVTLGQSLLATDPAQVVAGRNNAEEPGALFIVGNGDVHRSNALAVMQDGSLMAGAGFETAVRYAEKCVLQTFEGMGLAKDLGLSVSGGEIYVIWDGGVNSSSCAQVYSTTNAGGVRPQMILTDRQGEKLWIEQGESFTLSFKVKPNDEATLARKLFYWLCVTESETGFTATSQKNACVVYETQNIPFEEEWMTQTVTVTDCPYSGWLRLGMCTGTPGAQSSILLDDILLVRGDAVAYNYIAKNSDYTATLYKLSEVQCTVEQTEAWLTGRTLYMADGTEYTVDAEAVAASQREDRLDNLGNTILTDDNGEVLLAIVTRISPDDPDVHRCMDVHEHGVYVSPRVIGVDYLRQVHRKHHLQPDDSHVAPDRTWSSKNTVDKLCNPFTLTGDTVECHPVEHYPLDVTAAIEPVQEGSGDPSPDNVRPISGRDSVAVTRCGKNLLPYPYANKTKTVAGITYTDNGDGSITANGTATADSHYVLVSSQSVLPALLIPGNTYTVSGGASAGSDETYYWQFVYYFGNSHGKVIYDYGSGATAVCPEEATGVYARITIRGGTTVNNLVFWPQIELGNTATSYEQHREDTYNIPLGQTVYGGSLDVTGGVLTKTYKMFTLTGEETWRQYEQEGSFWNVWRIDLTEEFPSLFTGNPTASYNFFCSHFMRATTVLVRMTEGMARFVGGNSGFYIYSELATAEAVKSWVKAQYDAGTPVQVCYDDTTVETAALDPVEILAQNGSNTLYADSGDVTVTGREDPVYSREILEQRLAALEAALVNNV